MPTAQNTENKMKNKPALLKIIGFLNILLGLFGLIVSAAIAAIAARITDRTAGITIAVTGLSVALPMIAGGVGLLLKKNSGRLLSLAASCIALAAGIIYMVIVATGLFYIFAQLAHPLRIKFIMHIVVTLCICIYPILNIVVLHKKNIRDSLR